MAEAQEVHGLRVALVHRTRASDLRMAAAMDHDVDELDGRGDRRRGLRRPRPRLVHRRARAGRRRSRSRSSSPTAGRAGARCRACATRSTPRWRPARRNGWEELLRCQREYLDAFWERADVEIEGDEELQQAVRFALFHALQAGARAEQRAIPAKGLTGPGYDGHAFWDTRDASCCRCSPTRCRRPPPTRCKLAPRDARPRHRARARRSGCAAPRSPGARSAATSAAPTGRPAPRRSTSTPTSPTPCIRYVRATDDEDFERARGLELLVQTARLWRSLGHHDRAGAFHIDGVTGPDEYSAVADDNVYTNLMAEQNLRHAADAAPSTAREARAARRRRRGDRRLARRRGDDAHPLRRAPRVHPQAEGFTRHAPFDFERRRTTRCCCTSRTSSSTAPRWSSRPTSCSRCSCAATASAREEKARDFAYYEAMTVRDSSLSRLLPGRRRRRGRARRARLRLLRRGRPDGPRRPRAQHARRAAHRVARRARGSPPWPASAACATHAGDLSFRPRLPAALARLCFRMVYRGRRLRVDVSHGEATYELLAGEPLESARRRGDRLVVTSRRRASGRRRAPGPSRRSRPAGRRAGAAAANARCRG